MSRFFSEKYKNLEAYVPGEQPKDMKYIKLNTNESPYPPSRAVIDAVSSQAELLQLYSDPDLTEPRVEMARLLGVLPSNVIMTNGSDEVLNFAFMAYGDSTHPFVFADITYGFYTVFGDVNNIPYEIIPLKEDLSIDYREYCGLNKNIVIANPNAPTGLALELWKIEEIVKSNPDNIVIIDEAYVDFGAESAVGLTRKYDNLLVTQTFSKSRSMAGARLGFGVANEAIINDLNTVRCSTNPYNVNRMTLAAGAAALRDNDYYMENCRKIMSTREFTKNELLALGFEVTDSVTNFIFARHKSADGKMLYEELRKRGILVRHFSKERIREYNRITVGTKEQMEALIDTLKSILEEEK